MLGFPTTFLLQAGEFIPPPSNANVWKGSNSAEWPGQTSNPATAYPLTADLPRRRRSIHAQVESKMGAVAWGLRASAPFPIPAHRTGGRDLRLSDWLHRNAH